MSKSSDGKGASAGKPVRRLAMLTAATVALALGARAPLAQEAKGHCPDSASEEATRRSDAPSATERGGAAPVARMSIPDVPVRDQDGRRIRFYSDLIKGKVVALNFIFTTCTTICPPLAATFSKIQSLSGDRLGKDFHLISVSVDPVTDTPERLKAWGAKFHAQPGWTLVTGEKQNIDEILRALNVFTARREDHSPTVLIGNEAKGVWTRAYGLAPPAQLMRLIDDSLKGAAAGPAAGAPPKAPDARPPEGSPAQRYFTDVVLINQHGAAMRFYSDLIRGKVVIINTFFTSCTGVCPPMSRNLEKIQEALGDRLGKAVHIISLSVDPINDTPSRLKEYAQRFHAKPGWYFITGRQENLELALRKLGQYVQERDEHSSLMIIGNERTGLWKKAFGLAKSEELIKVVESVLNDQHAEQ